MLLHFVSQMGPCSGWLHLPKNPPFGLRPAPPFGRCILPPPPPAGGDESPSVVRVQVVAPLRSALPAPLPERWSFRQRQGYGLRPGILTRSHSLRSFALRLPLSLLTLPPPSQAYAKWKQGQGRRGGWRGPQRSEDTGHPGERSGP